MQRTRLPIKANPSSRPAMGSVQTATNAEDEDTDGTAADSGDKENDLEAPPLAGAVGPSVCGREDGGYG